MMKFILFTTFFLCLQVSHALEVKLSRSGLDDQQVIWAKKHIQMMKRILPQSYQKIRKVKIRFAKVRKSDLAYYDPMDRKIIVSRSLLEESQKNSFELLRTLIHEMTHAYSLQVEPLEAKSEYIFLSRNNVRGYLLNGVKKKKIDYSQSPYSYEFTNREEHLAVNMEYFLTDRSYKCRRPLHYAFLTKNLNHIPFKDIDCYLYDLEYAPVYHNGLINWLALNPRKLEVIEYLSLQSQSKGRPSYSFLKLNFSDGESYLYGYLPSAVKLAQYPKHKYLRPFLLNPPEVLARTPHAQQQVFSLTLNSKQKERLIQAIIYDLWTLKVKRTRLVNSHSELFDLLKVVVQKKKLYWHSSHSTKKNLRLLDKVGLKGEEIQLDLSRYSEILRNSFTPYYSLRIGGYGIPSARELENTKKRTTSYQLFP